MKKLILIILIICGLAINIFADLPNPPSTEIKDGAPLIARPVYNSLFSLYDILNGKINSLNIKLGGINVDRLAGGITPFYLSSPFDINSILADGNITYAKLNSDIFGGAASVIHNNGYIDLRFNTSLFEKDGSNNLNIKNNSITGTQINTNLAGAGLSFDTSTPPQALKVNVDSTTIKINEDILELQASVSLDGGTTYLKPNIAISANASDSLQTINKTSIVSAINEINSSAINKLRYDIYLNSADDTNYTQTITGFTINSTSRFKITLVANCTRDPNYKWHLNITTNNPNAQSLLMGKSWAGSACEFNGNHFFQKILTETTDFSLILNGGMNFYYGEGCYNLGFGDGSINRYFEITGTIGNSAYPITSFTLSLSRAGGGKEFIGTLILEIYN